MCTQEAKKSKAKADKAAGASKAAVAAGGKVASGKSSIMGFFSKK